MQKTFSPKAKEITREWHVIDASGVPLGRLASQVAQLLRGKHKPTFAPHLDSGDHVDRGQRSQDCPDRRQAGSEEVLPPLGVSGWLQGDTGRAWSWRSGRSA